MVQQAEEADLYIPVNREKFQISTAIKSIHFEIFYQSKFFFKLSLLFNQQRASHSDEWLIWAVVCFLCCCILGGKNSFHCPGIKVCIFCPHMCSCVLLYISWTHCNENFTGCFWAGDSCNRPLWHLFPNSSSHHALKKKKKKKCPGNTWQWKHWGS